jgi:hypothetical protein
MEVLGARHPTSRVGILTDQQRHDLAVIPFIVVDGVAAEG